MAAPSPDRLKSIERIFHPSSIDVVGSTKVPGTVPYDIFYNILRDSYQGTLYPVSPNARSICSVKAYRYVVDIPDPVDLAVLVFPAAVCHLALEQCGQKGITGAIIISAGFREVGPAGVEREEQIKSIAAKHGISFIGPNCLGLINTNPSVHLNASFASRMPAEGSIGFLLCIKVGRTPTTQSSTPMERLQRARFHCARCRPMSIGPSKRREAWLESSGNLIRLNAC